MAKLFTILTILCSIFLLKLNAQVIAHYPFAHDGVDVTGNSPDMLIENCEFTNNSVYSNGIYHGSNGNGSYLATPTLNDFNSQSFEIEIEFKIEESPEELMSVLVLGQSYRPIELHITEQQTIGLRLNGTTIAHTNEVCQLNTWHKAKIYYNSETVFLFFDYQQVIAKRLIINLPENDRKIINSYAGSGSTFKGYWKNLVVKSINEINIFLGKNDNNGGSVSGAGTYNFGETIEITATPNTGYEFDCWTVNHIPVSSDAVYRFEANAEKTYIANFRKKTYEVITDSYPANRGTVYGAGTYEYGEVAVLRAVPYWGYEFLFWTENDRIISRDRNISPEITQNRNLLVFFDLKKYDIEANTNIPNSGRITGTGTYKFGETAVLNATPKIGYVFKNWTVNGYVVSANSEYFFVVRRNRNLIANFEAKSYSITSSVTPAYGGSVGGQGTYSFGKTVALTALPRKGYRFVNWTENGKIVHTQQNYSFTCDGNRNLVANFAFGSSKSFSKKNGLKQMATINTVENEISIQVYPNPTKDNVNVAISNLQINDQSEIQLYLIDITGKKLLLENSNINGNMITINVSSLKSGIYHLQLVMNNNLLKSTKLVIN